MTPLTVLIVNRSMFATSGTELYVRDVALELQRQGHRPVVFTPAPGSVSDQLKAAGIRIVADVDELDETPDIVHGQHAWTTMAALARFPATPAIFVGHDATSWTDAPPRLPQIRRYVAVDHFLYQRFIDTHTIPQSQVSVIPNAIDFRRFRQRGPLPERPKRALLISNYSGPYERGEIQAACDSRGISLEAVGRRFGNITDRPEDLYGDFDLVFAKGRCFLEAAATGVAVVYCDTLGCGPILTEKILDQGQGILAGRHLLAEPLDRQVLVRRIDEYDPVETLAVSRRVRAAYDANEIVARLVVLYRQSINEHRLDAKSGCQEQWNCSLARELVRWSNEAEGLFHKHFESIALLLPDEYGTRKQPHDSPRSESGQVIWGDGWYPPQQDPRGEYRWLGPAPEAWVDLVVPSTGATHLRCQIAHAMDPELMRGLEIRINGEPTQKQHSRGEEAIVCARIPGGISAQEGARLRVSFRIPRTIRPGDMREGSRDRRLLGLAFRHIVLEKQESGKNHGMGKITAPAHPIGAPQPEIAKPENMLPPMPVVFGSPRSGTTLLRMMLDSHPELAVPPETGFLALARKLCESQDNVLQTFFETVTGYPPEAPGWADFGIPAIEFRSRLAGLDPFSVTEGYRLFYRMYAERFGKTRWGDKTPLYGHHLKMIQEFLPEARFIHVVRDGRDAAVSLRKLWFSPGHAIQSQATWWRDNILAARQQGRRCRHFLEVRYEDLLGNTKAELQRICEFSGLEFHADMLNYFERSPMRLSEHLTRYRIDGSVLAAHQERLQVQQLVMAPPDLSRIGVWRAGLSSAEGTEFESIAGELLVEYGYLRSA